MGEAQEPLLLERGQGGQSQEAGSAAAQGLPVGGEAAGASAIPTAGLAASGAAGLAANGAAGLLQASREEHVRYDIVVGSFDGLGATIVESSARVLRCCLLEESRWQLDLAAIKLRTQYRVYRMIRERVPAFSKACLIVLSTPIFRGLAFDKKRYVGGFAQ